MSIALISDIHGNVLALEAVLKDIAVRNISKIINLGDSLYGPLWPQETADILISENIESIMGNGDEVLITEPRKTPTIEYTVRYLNTKTFEWLNNLKEIYLDNDITCFHGSPANKCAYLVEKIENGKVIIKDNTELLKDIEGITTRMIACGHSHIERIMNVNNKIIINAGSVGLPAYDDTEPTHKMETFNTNAKYIIIDGNNIEIVFVKYDNEKSAKQAERNGRNDWKNWILKGRA